jgi:branched-chain amino acid transport system ATP-binding protein
MAAMLEVIGLSKRFGGVTALKDVSLSLAKGARHALIGPTGAGKSTFIDLLAGTVPPSSGRIRLGGRDITDCEPYERVQFGIARTFQIGQLFPQMTPLETLTLAVSERMALGAQWWRLAGSDSGAVEEIAALIERFHLGEVMHRRAARLSSGERRRLEVALAFACRPLLLLLDEPAAGLPDGERSQLSAALAALPADTAMLLVEQDLEWVVGLADRVSVMANGALIADGVPEDIACDPRVGAICRGEAANA